MKRIGFNRCFVNAAENDLVPGKIHTIRANYDYWKQFEGKELSLFYWEGKPCRSKQIIFCEKRLVGVESAYHRVSKGVFGVKISDGMRLLLHEDIVAKNDGFSKTDDFIQWFKKYPLEIDMAILHFTDFWYGRKE